LKLNRTLESFDHAGKFEQQAVTHRLDDAPMMLTDLGPNQFFAMRFLAGDRPLLVLSHEATVADHIDREDRNELARNVLVRHAAPSD
jgi:hypothetical protein